MLNIDDLFKSRHFDREIIVLCVRWYLRFKLSFRDLVEMMTESGIGLASATIMRRIARDRAISKGSYGRKDHRKRIRLHLIMSRIHRAAGMSADTVASFA